MKQFRIKIISGNTKEEVAKALNNFVAENADLIDSFMGEKNSTPYISSVYSHTGGEEKNYYEIQLAFYLTPKGVTEGKF